MMRNKIFLIAVVLCFAAGLFFLYLKDNTKEPVITETSKQKNIYEIGTTISFIKNGDSVNYIPDPRSSGWSQPETNHTWTNSGEAVLSINLNNSDNKDLKLRMEAFPFLGKGKLKQQTVDVSVNGSKVVSWNVTKKGWYEADIPASANNDSKLMLKFTISDPLSPKELGLSKDARKLGIAVTEMVIAEK